MPRFLAFLKPSLILLTCAFILSLLVAISLPFLTAMDVTRVHFDTSTTTQDSSAIDEIRVCFRHSSFFRLVLLLRVPYRCVLPVVWSLVSNAGLSATRFCGRSYSLLLSSGHSASTTPPAQRELAQRKVHNRLLSHHLLACTVSGIPPLWAACAFFLHCAHVSRLRPPNRRAILAHKPRPCPIFCSFVSLTVGASQDMATAFRSSPRRITSRWSSARAGRVDSRYTLLVRVLLYPR